MALAPLIKQDRPRSGSGSPGYPQRETLPREIASEVEDVSDEVIAAENAVLDAMRQPQPSIEVLRSARTESQNQAARLRQRVSRK